MKIRFLDAYTTNPGDLSFDAFHSIGDFIAYERTELHEVSDRAGDADIIVVNKFPVNEESLRLMPKVKYICVAATGYNNIDLSSTKIRNIQVSNVSGYSSPSVAQHVFASLLAYANRTEYYASEVRKGRWAKTADFCFYDHKIEELYGKTFGIVGYGNIGKQVASIALAFGMKVIVHSRTEIFPLQEGIKMIEKEELFRQADFISLHCPLTSSTKEIVNQETLKWMKTNAVLINTGRGALVNEKDLLQALNGNIIRCAILDVLQVEPPSVNHPLVNHPKCMITPHIAWASKESRQRLLNGVAENINSWLHGHWVNRVE
jgi:glycerate dehydrogenase